MQKIIPHLWFDTQAQEAAAFYVAAFKDLGDSKVLSAAVLNDTPSGDTSLVRFMLAGFELMAISAGPYFKLNPSVSFMLNFDPSRDAQAREHLDALWELLSEGGSALMPLQEYPFSKRYGWMNDKFGVSWQLMLTNPEGEERPFIIPSLLFTGKENKAEQAREFYLSVFKDAKPGALVPYPAGAEPTGQAGAIMFSDFQLEGQWFTAMDGGPMHDFSFNEALSLLVQANTQEEIDYYWEKLSADPAAEQCGWLKDGFGVSWQVAPVRMQEMMREGTPEQLARVTQCFLKMKKFNLAELEAAYAGK